MKNFHYLFLLFGILFQLNCKAQVDVKLTDEKKVIVIYGSPDCHYCIDLKEQLLSNKIDFTFYDIDHDNKALNEMLTKLKAANISTNNLAIPVVDKYGKIYLNNGNFDAFIKLIIQ